MKKLFILLTVFNCLLQFQSFGQQTKQVQRGPKVEYDPSQMPGLISPKPAVPLAGDIFNFDPEYQSKKVLHPISKSKAGPEVKIWSEDGLPVWIEGRLSSNIKMPDSQKEQIMVYLESVKRKMQIKEPSGEFSEIESHSDKEGITHATLQQKYAGLDVYGAQIKIHLDQEGPFLVNGRFFPSSKLQKFAPAITELSAIETVKNDVSRIAKFKDLSDSDLYLIENHKQFLSDLVIYHKNRQIQAEYLAWHIVVYPNIMKRYEYFIDAQNGEVLHYFETLCGFHSHDRDAQQTMGPLDGPVTANATDLNNKTQLINTYQVGSKFYMIDASKSMFNGAQSTFPNNPVGTIITLDGMNKSPNSGNFSYTIVNSNNNSWVDKASVSSHWNASECYKYFLATHGRNSIDGHGSNIISLVNIADDDGSGLDNAFWNGEAMFYGNGNFAFKPLAGGLDVGGHEMSHGVVQSTANLEYQGESGALNESFADIFGTMIDRNDWLLGEDIIKNNSFPSGALRSMSDPHNGGNSLNDNGWQPKHMNEKYNGSQDNGGVHINSGIVNYAFFLFASDANVGKDKAEKVYYKALTDYLVKSSVFIDERAAVVQAAKDLYGNSSPVVTAAENAFSQVGIGGGGNAGGTVYQKDLPVNPGSDFIVATDGQADQVYLAYGSNFSNITSISLKSPKNRFSVTDDGSTIVYVGIDKRIHGIDINYSNGDITEFDISTNPVWANVAISKDGNRIAAVTDAKSNEVWIYDFNIQQWKTFTLYNPTFSEGVTTGDVLFADILEWDYSGNYVMYDAYNEIKDQSGNTIHYWDIGFLRAYNKKTGSYGDGNISKLYSGLPENTSIGNPAFSKNSPYIIAFDYIDEFENTNYIVGTNLETGDEDAIIQQDELGYPSYSRLDDYIIHNAPGDEIGIVELGSNKISSNGTSSNLFTDGRLGFWYANGKREINISIHEQIKETDNWLVYPNIVRNDVTLKALDTHGKGLVQLFNIYGSQIAAYELDALNEGSAQLISLSALSAGSYLVRISAGDHIQTTKIIKQ